jgi:hypothetical protein
VDLLSGPALGAACALGSAAAWAVSGLLVRTVAAALGSVAVNAVRSALGGGLLVAFLARAAGDDQITNFPHRSWLRRSLQTSSRFSAISGSRPGTVSLSQVSSSSEPRMNASPS